MTSSNNSNRNLSRHKAASTVAGIVGLGDLGTLVLDGIVPYCGVVHGARWAEKGAFLADEHDNLVLGFLLARGDEKEDSAFRFLFEDGEQKKELQSG